MYVYITFHDGLFVDNWISMKKKLICGFLLEI